MPVIFLILHLNVPSTLNKGINVFEIRVETLLFKPMDKLTCYPVITPLKDPMRNLIGSFLSLPPPRLFLFHPHHSYKEISTSSLGGKLNSRMHRDNFLKDLNFTSSSIVIQLWNCSKYQNFEIKLFKIVTNTKTLNLALSIAWNILKIQWRSIDHENRGGSSCSLALLLASPPAIYTAREVWKWKAGRGTRRPRLALGLARNNFADCQIVSWFCLGPRKPNSCGLLRQQFEWRVFGIWNKRTSRAWTMDTRPCSINIGISNTRPKWLSTRVKGSRHAFYVLYSFFC